MTRSMTTFQRIVLLCAVFFIVSTGFSLSGARGYTPPSGFVPDKETAIKIAEAIWLPIYGKNIYATQPFIAELNGDSTWHVYGTLPRSSISINEKGDTVYTIRTGGVPHIFINKSDGKILEVTHTK